MGRRWGVAVMAKPRSSEQRERSGEERHEEIIGRHGEAKQVPRHLVALPPFLSMHQRPEFVDRLGSRRAAGAGLGARPPMLLDARMVQASPALTRNATPISARISRDDRASPT